MSEAAGLLARRATELRLDFDRSFAQQPRTETEQTVDFLAVLVGAEPCALRLSTISGLYADKKLTHLPGGHAALLGIAGFRGTILPVYSLRGLLGRVATETPRWMVVAADAPIVLAFEGFQGHLRIPGAAVLPRQAEDRHSYAREYASAQGQVRPIIDLPSALSSISIRGPEAGPRQEP